MTNPISFLFDWLLDLTRPGADPGEVRTFIANPTQAASPALGDRGDPGPAHAGRVRGCRTGRGLRQQRPGPGAAAHGRRQQRPDLRAAADVRPETDFASHNATQLASNNDIGSPRAGEDAQQGVGNVDLDFDFSRDINTPTARVVNTGNAGDIDTTSVHGDGNVVGDDNDGANTGDVYAGQGSNVQAGGKNNDLHDSSHDVNTRRWRRRHQHRQRPEHSGRRHRHQRWRRCRRHAAATAAASSASAVTAATAVQRQAAPVAA